MSRTHGVRSFSFLTRGCSFATRHSRRKELPHEKAICRKVYEAGFTPICPVLYLPHFLRDSIPAEHKDGIDIGRELLRRSHVLIVCGDEVDESVKNDIAVAQRLGITATTLDGILKIHAQGENEVEG